MDRSASPSAQEERHSESSPLLAESGSNVTTTKRRSRLTSIVAPIVLVFLFALALVVGFILPHAAQSYVEETLQVDIRNIEVTAVHESGIDICAQGDIFLDASKSDRSNARRLTNVLLFLAGPISISDSSVVLSLEHKGSHKVATADVGDLTLRLANSQKSPFDLRSVVKVRNADVIGEFARLVAEDGVRVIPINAIVQAKITRGFSVRKTVSRRIDYELPGHSGGIPAYNITSLSARDSSTTGIYVEAAITVAYQSLLDAVIPSVVLEASIMGCNGDVIPLAVAENMPFHVSRDSASVSIVGSGHCREIPKPALRKCGDANSQSPLDVLMESYLAGNDTTVFVSGHSTEDRSWLQELLSHVHIPIQIAGNQNEQLARDIELSDVKMNLPSFFGGGGKPKISGKIRGIIDIPSDIKVDVQVDSVHVLADLLYKGKKFAYLESPGWAPASSRFPKQEELLVEVTLKDAPVTITNQDVFSSVVSQLLGGNVLVDVLGTGDVKVITSLGKLEAHKLPIEAKDIEIEGFGFLGNLQPKIKQLGVLQTTSDSMELVAEAHVHNPTAYQIYVSYLDALLTFENRTLGHVTIENASVTEGKNTIRARLTYAPMRYSGGDANSASGSHMLGQYLSEIPVNATLEAHDESLPDYPNLSHALAHLPLRLALPIPRLINDDGGDDDDDDKDGPGEDTHTGSQFLVSAKFHLLSSSASFVLRNPLNESVTVTDLHAVARYHDDVVGVLDYVYPITLSGAEPITETTRIPVTWKLPASDILRRAVRGTLKVNATAEARVSVGNMESFPIRLTLYEVGAGVGI